MGAAGTTGAYLKVRMEKVAQVIELSSLFEYNRAFEQKLKLIMQKEIETRKQKHLFKRLNVA